MQDKHSTIMVLCIYLILLSIMKMYYVQRCTWKLAERYRFAFAWYVTWYLGTHVSINVLSKKFEDVNTVSFLLWIEITHVCQLRNFPEHKFKPFRIHKIQTDTLTLCTICDVIFQKVHASDAHLYLILKIGFFRLLLDQTLQTCFHLR